MLDLVADIGGTNARFALSHSVSGSKPELSDFATFRCADLPSLTDAANAYFEKLGPARRPRRGAVAIAGPVESDAVKLTNNPWSFSVAQTRKALDFDDLSILNDCTAAAYALPHLGSGDIEPIGPFDNRMNPGGERALALLAPGTGLGVGGLLRSHAAVVPLTSEGGHTSFAPTDDVELAILRYLTTRFGRVSNERILCGEGIVNLYHALCEIHGTKAQTLTAKDITEQAIANEDETCRAALERFCLILGSVAGDVGLTLRASTVFIGGGIVPRFVPFLKQSGFRTRFENKGRFAELMTRTRTAVIMADYPGLLGAAAYLGANPQSRDSSVQRSERQDKA